MKPFEIPHITKHRAWLIVRAEEPGVNITQIMEVQQRESCVLVTYETDDDSMDCEATLIVPDDVWEAVNPYKEMRQYILTRKLATAKRVLANATRQAEIALDDVTLARKNLEKIEKEISKQQNQ